MWPSRRYAFNLTSQCKQTNKEIYTKPKGGWKKALRHTWNLKYELKTTFPSPKLILPKAQALGLSFYLLISLFGFGLCSTGNKYLKGNTRNILITHFSTFWSKRKVFYCWCCKNKVLNKTVWCLLWGKGSTQQIALLQASNAYDMSLYYFLILGYVSALPHNLCDIFAFKILWSGLEPRILLTA